MYRPMTPPTPDQNSKYTHDPQKLEWILPQAPKLSHQAPLLIWIIETEAANRYCMLQSHDTGASHSTRIIQQSPGACTHHPRYPRGRRLQAYQAPGGLSPNPSSAPSWCGPGYLPLLLGAHPRLLEGN